jgi:hypothetical protein
MSLCIIRLFIHDPDRQYLIILGIILAKNRSADVRAAQRDAALSDSDIAVDYAALLALTKHDFVLGPRSCAQRGWRRRGVLEDVVLLTDAESLTR